MTSGTHFGYKSGTRHYDTGRKWRRSVASKIPEANENGWGTRTVR